MLDDLRNLYQEVILDHSKRPRNFRRPDDANCMAHGNNPICGDMLVVYITLNDDGVILDAAFEGKGCAISIASASMMTELLKDKTSVEAYQLFENFHNMCINKEFNPADLTKFGEEAVYRLKMLSGVREFPIRVKCATLAWHAMQAAINNKKEISTELDTPYNS